MKAPWHDNRFVVQMPHMAPGERLSEVEFLKILAAYQWSGIAHMLGRKPSQITNDARERLYGSVIDVEMKLAPQHSMEVLGEDAEIRVRNRVASYAKKFVEGLFVIDDHDVPDSLLATLKTREDLRSLPVSWACMTNAFIAPTGSNTQALGQLLYVQYVYPFEIAAVVLLVAIIAAIALTHRERKERKHQDPGRQVKVRREDRVRLVNLSSGKPPG